MVVIFREPPVLFSRWNPHRAAEARFATEYRAVGRGSSERASACSEPVVEGAGDRAAIEGRSPPKTASRIE
jgi:hypothetical protein